jgi:hypothetical protein
MEKDDFRYQLSFGADVSAARDGGTWSAPGNDAYVASGTIPVMLDEQTGRSGATLSMSMIWPGRSCARWTTRGPPPDLQHLHG